MDAIDTYFRERKTRNSNSKKLVNIGFDDDLIKLIDLVPESSRPKRAALIRIGHERLQTDTRFKQLLIDIEKEKARDVEKDKARKEKTQ